ncbi:MAG: class I SAM-dependent methyltransferase [Anaerolineales bacterium]|jgi:SAM-dependent methyltransferase
MQDHISATLHRINSEFYQTFAESFANTRGRLQPGVLNLMENLSRDANVLDLGCGHGQIARWRLGRGDQGRTAGIDSSSSLLALTADLAGETKIDFAQVDLAQGGWSEQVRQRLQNYPANGFDWVFAFAVMHHLPGQQIRQAFVHQSVRLLREHGSMAVSNWNFLASQRLRERILPWETIDLSADDVDPGDYLLDWRRDGHGLRYVHHFTDKELAELAEQAGLTITNQFYSDGETGKLGLYQVWSR